MIKHFVRVSTGLVLAVVSQFALAGLLGTTVSQCANTSYFGVVTADTAACDPGNTQPLPGSAVVDAGVEFRISNNRLFDFDDDSLTISYVQPVASASPDLIIFTMEQVVGGISLIGANALDVTWTSSGNLLGILISGPRTDGSVVLRFDPEVVDVPEPGALSLAILALLGMAAMTGLKRRS